MSKEPCSRTIAVVTANEFGRRSGAHDRFVLSSDQGMLFAYGQAVAEAVLDHEKNKDFNQLKVRVINFMAKHPGCLQTEICEALKITPTLASRVVAAIRKDWRKDKNEKTMVSESSPARNGLRAD